MYGKSYDPDQFLREFQMAKGIWDSNIHNHMTNIRYKPWKNRYTLIWRDLCFRLRYYSVYILISTGAILVMAATVHFFVETVANEDPCENNNNKYKIGKSQMIIRISSTKSSIGYIYITTWYSSFIAYFIGWKTLAAFYSPAALLLMINIFFYWTSQRTMARELLYNKNIHHFQVK